MKLRLLLVLCGSLLPLSLQAGLITAPVGGTTTTFPGSSGTCPSSSGSATVAGFDISTSGYVCYDYGGGWGLDGNGSWSLSLIGINSSNAAITIELGGLFSSVGGFMNYAPDYGAPVITALAADGTTVLESYDLSVDAPISTPFDTNAGAFRGISRGSADIAYFRIAGSYLAMHDITLSGGTEAVPEPGSVLLCAAGLAALGFWRRVRQA
jgi:hypothetical protein